MSKTRGPQFNTRPAFNNTHITHSKFANRLDLLCRVLTTKQQQQWQQENQRDTKELWEVLEMSYYLDCGDGIMGSKSSNWTHCICTVLCLWVIPPYSWNTEEWKIFAAGRDGGRKKWDEEERNRGLPFSKLLSGERLFPCSYCWSRTTLASTEVQHLVLGTASKLMLVTAAIGHEYLIHSWVFFLSLKAIIPFPFLALAYLPQSSKSAC